MACSKYTLTNTGSTIVNFNYRRCDDSMWDYQVELTPNQTKNIWLLDGTFSIAPVYNSIISLVNQGPFPPISETSTPTPTSTTPTSTTPTPTATSTPTPTSTSTPTPTSTSVPPTSTPTNTPTPTPTATIAPNTFNVTNDGSSNYLINGQSDPTLSLTEGQTYTFNVNASGHPFWIKTVSSTGTGNAYNSGVTNNGTASGIITFVVPYDAPSTLYYNCQFHSSMAGIINVIDVSPTATPTSTVTSTPTPTKTPSLNVCVSGAGSSFVNGTYIYNGDITYQGYTRPSYVFGPYELDIEINGPRWVIKDPSGDRFDYYVGNTIPPPAFPYQETSWSLADGQAPVPTVRQGGC